MGEALVLSPALSGTITLLPLSDFVAKAFMKLSDAS